MSERLHDSELLGWCNKMCKITHKINSPLCNGDFSGTEQYKEVELLHTFWDPEKAALSLVPWNETPNQLYYCNCALCSEAQKTSPQYIIFQNIYHKKDRLL